MTRGVTRAKRSPLSDETKAELSRVALAPCDRRVLAALLPRARHLGMPARRLAHTLLDLWPSARRGAPGGRTRSAGRSPAPLARACCRRTYLRGVFLAGGSLSAGPSGYVLELRPPRGEVGRARAMLVREGFVTNERVRRGRAVLALRDATAIAAFLRAAGAGETLLRFESLRVSREVRGRTNALVNAESANLARAVVAARRQTEAIRALAAAGGVRSLPEPIRDAVRARLRSPSATLADLARRLGTTKWVVRSRLRAAMR